MTVTTNIGIVDASGNAVVNVSNVWVITTALTWPDYSVSLLLLRRRGGMTTQLLPLVYPLTIGTSSTQIMPPNPGRRGIVFYNPGASSVAVCPAVTSTGAPNPAVMNGAGSITIASLSVVVMPPVAWTDWDRCGKKAWPRPKGDRHSAGAGCSPAPIICV